MAIFRIQKTRDYTIISNHHLKNKALSLKAKGLLSQMLSLPDEWDFSLKGLSHINRESIDAVRTAVWELEKAGYIVRRQGRDDKGKMTAVEYTIYEQPQLEPPPELECPESSSPASGSPESESPVLENPTPAKPISDMPTLGNTTQLITNGSRTYPIKDSKAANPNPSNPHPSLPRAPEEDDRMGWDRDGWAAGDSCREAIENRIEYDVLAQDAHIPRGRLDEIVDIMAEVLCATNSTMTIAGNEYPTLLVRERFRQIGSRHIQYVFECLNKNTSRVRNIKKYLLAVLFNAPSTMDGYYAAKINHDFGNIDLDDYDF
jgi:hypothetical protein